MASAREEILNKLKKAVHPEPEKPDFDTPVYLPIDKPLDEAFKENLEKVNGSVFLCESEKQLAEELRSLLKLLPTNTIVCKDENLLQVLKKHRIQVSSADDLPENIEAGITSCEILVAHTGSVMVSSALPGGRQLFVYPPLHIVLARKEQLVPYLADAYSAIQKKYAGELPSQITIVTGPSRTADIEKTLVMGAHGPRKLCVLIW